MTLRRRQDSADDRQRATGATSDQWILRALDSLSGEIRSFRTEVKTDNDAIKERLRKLENRASYLIGGIVVTLVFITFLGWILAPVVQVLVEKTIGI